MNSATTYHGPYSLTSYGGGVAVLLRKGEYAIHWQGDEAAEILDGFTNAFYDDDEGAARALDEIWSAYADAAQHSPTE